MEDSELSGPQVRITSRLIDSLYTEAMLLADETRSYFDDIGRDERARRAVEAGDGAVAALLRAWAEESRRFAAEARPYHLYR